MSKLESQIEIPVVEYAKRKGFKVRKARWQNARNAPDRLFFRPAAPGRPPRAFFVEFKAPGERPRPAQEREIRLLREAGIEVHVVDTVEAGEALIDADA